MNLQEFRDAIASDATKRADVQESTIKDLHSQVRKLKAEIVTRDQWIAQLERRCMVTGHGILCLFCGHRDTCTGRKDKPGGEV